MHLILTGATGMVGTTVLDAMLKTTDISKISILSRRPVQLAEDAKEPRVNVIIHKDFSSYNPEVLNKIQDADGCVWALGISQTQVNKEDYVTITKTYPLAFASAFQPGLQTANKPFNFVYVSGQGSTFKPGLFTPIFGKTKGETELALADIRKKNPLFQASTVRPGFVDWIEQDKKVTGYMPDMGVLKTGFGHLLHSVIGFAMRDNWSPTEPLGGFLTGLAMGKWSGELKGLQGGEGQVLEGGFPVVENKFMRRVMGLDR
ncbi:hypothetical protein B0T21DRAFT_289559 [Apiosordaria backusii]|uniref:NAD(P)-binding domain-containing protein n=1 Tax=Apiosordaria backusii TaxID=314023 RepID=A0AA40BL49_9PEZI|nr:hypothetical protein B0T21DRAFT_289559 [Apiosordaria backusii]